MPPSFAYDGSIRSIDNLLTGAPFSGSEPSPLLATFIEKVSNLELAPDARDAHIATVSEVLRDEVGPAYLRLTDVLKDQATRATDLDGAWKLPDGEAYYRHNLKRRTTTSLDPDTIHALGLAEVDRIHDEMRELQAQLGVPGELSDFFAHVQQHPDLTLPDSPEGRAQYLALAGTYVTGMDARLDEVVATRPRAAWR